MGSEPPGALCHHDSRPCRDRSHRSEKRSQLPRNIFNKLHSALWLLALQLNPLQRPHTGVGQPVEGIRPVRLSRQA